MKGKQVFDEWPEKYDRWFETPIGGIVKEVESRLVMKHLEPAAGERILDAGCGTGIFTADFLKAGTDVVGLELSYPMVARAARKLSGRPFTPVAGDMTALPFADECFDKVVSVTAIEFIADAEGAVEELFRVTKPGGRVLVATLNSLSPWAARRTDAGKKGHDIFKKIYFRSPKEMMALKAAEGCFETAVHFEKTEDPARAREIEMNARRERPEKGAFLLASWIKP
ncbi:MAG TPA: class I SAM-dependent methyltransferase [Desulfobacteraceae bacterium]|nr:class I SAM-dependent methyltransferase [Desulfobacteraceae bacterium]